MNDDLAASDIDDIEIELLLEALYRRYHYDFRHYARASIKRRLVQARERLSMGLSGNRSHRARQDGAVGRR